MNGGERLVRGKGIKGKRAGRRQTAIRVKIGRRSRECRKET